MISLLATASRHVINTQTETLSNGVTIARNNAGKIMEENRFFVRIHTNSRWEKGEPNFVEITEEQYAQIRRSAERYADSF